VNLLCEVYQKEMSLEAVKGYILTLDDLPIPDVRQAFLEAMRRARTGFLPTPGEIRAALEILKAATTKPGRTNANLDCNLCGGTGYKIVAALDPKTHQVIPGHQSAKLCDCLRHVSNPTERR
jgi:hypothetical protein